MLHRSTFNKYLLKLIQNNRKPFLKDRKMSETTQHSWLPKYMRHLWPWAATHDFYTYWHQYANKWYSDKEKNLTCSHPLPCPSLVMLHFTAPPYLQLGDVESEVASQAGFDCSPFKLFQRLWTDFVQGNWNQPELRHAFLAHFPNVGLLHTSKAVIRNVHNNHWKSFTLYVLLR